MTRASRRDTSTRAQKGQKSLDPQGYLRPRAKKLLYLTTGGSERSDWVPSAIIEREQDLTRPAIIRARLSFNLSGSGTAVKASWRRWCAACCQSAFFDFKNQPDVFGQCPALLLRGTSKLLK